MSDRVCKVLVRWDEEAEVWIATSNDVQGLAIEADTMDEMLKRLEEIVPVLLEENAVEPPLLDRWPLNVEVPMMAQRLRSAASS